MTIDILMNDRRMFSTDPDENNLKSLKNTYWYIKHYSGETDTSWNLRFWDVDDISTYGLAYGKTVYDRNGKVVGMIVLTSRYEALFRTFQKLVSDGVKVIHPRPERHHYFTHQSQPCWQLGIRYEDIPGGIWKKYI